MPSTERIENSFEDFRERFWQLQQEAKGYGIAALTVLLDDDRLSEVEDKVVLFTDGHMKSVGMAEYAKWLLLNRRAEESE